MKKELFAGILSVLFLVGIAAAVKPGPSAENGLAHAGEASQLYLYEKTGVPDWDIVEGGAWGKMTYSEDSLVFNGHGLEKGVEYTLVSYCGWPNVEILGVRSC